MVNGLKTTEQRIEEFRAVWGDRFLFDLVDYKGAYVPVTVVCPTHGDFQVGPRHLLAGGHNCTECRLEEGTFKVRDTASFVIKAQHLWGDRWDYSKVEYQDSRTKVRLICPKHGEFLQSPSQLLSQKVGCRECLDYRRDSTESFIVKARKVHGGKYDYSEVEYVGSTLPVVIKCPTHGSFQQLPTYHLQGKEGCIKCRPHHSQETFLQKSQEVWGDRWDYSQAEYKGIKEKLTIVCREHGPFQQSPAAHWRGGVGCRKCLEVISSVDAVIAASQQIWGDRWDYSYAQDILEGYNILIRCRDHDAIFKQVYHNHLRGYLGCPKCKWSGTSKAENHLADRLREVGLRVETGRRDLLLGGKVEIDIYLPEVRVGIEYNGCYYHSEAHKEASYHYNKAIQAQEAGIRLIQVWEDDYEFRPQQVWEHILQVVGKSQLPKVAARKTKVVEVATKEAKTFFERYHIQGFVGSSYYLSLQYKGSIVALASFKREGNDYNLTRYATSANVQGGHSKIVAYFERNYQYDKLITFADLAFSDGGLYRKTGWEEVDILPPDYRYWYKGQRHHKFGFRKARFRDDPALRYEDGMSERELAQLNGLLRVYDAGKIKFVKHRPTDTIENGNER